MELLKPYKFKYTWSISKKKIKFWLIIEQSGSYTYNAAQVI